MIFAQFLNKEKKDTKDRQLYSYSFIKTVPSFYLINTLKNRFI